jgi:ClpX C4-type zinc finger
MKREPPPPVINSARVLAYAFVDDIPYRRAGSTLFVDGKPLEQVPCLAIAANLGEDSGPLILHCDEEWNALGTSGAATIEDMKRDAERNYPGVSTRWVDTNVTVEDALAYYDSETGGQRCSFCGKRPFEVDGWIEGAAAIICYGCIEEFYRDVRSGTDEIGG